MGQEMKVVGNCASQQRLKESGKKTDLHDSRNVNESDLSSRDGWYNLIHVSIEVEAL